MIWRTRRRDADAPRLAGFLAAGDSSHAAVWRQALEQFLHGLGLARQDEFGRDFREWLENETALMCSGMRQRQVVAMPCLFAECEQIQVNRTRLVMNLLWLTPERAFKRLQFLQERLRRFAWIRPEPDHCIDERRRPRRAIHG